MKDKLKNDKEKLKIKKNSLNQLQTVRWNEY